jgi:hypothetical protein
MPGITPYPDRVEAVRSLAIAGDVAGLADELAAIAAINGGRWGYDGRKVTDLVDGLPEPMRAELTMALIERAKDIAEAEHRNAVNTLVQVVARRFSGRLSPVAAAALLAMAAHQASWHPGDQLAVYAQVLIEAGRSLPGEVVAVLRRTVHGECYNCAALKALTATLADPVVNPGEAWADRVIADLPGLGGSWRVLVAHAATATGARPSQRWERQARLLLDAAGITAAGPVLRGWLALVGRPRTLRLNRREFEPDVNEAFDPFNATAIRGLIWLTALLPDEPDTARLLGSLVETALRKAAGIGPRNPKVANAAVYALSRIPTEAALAQLARLAATVTYKGTVKELNAALEARAAALGLSREEVEELAVPTYGLSEVGRRLDQFGAASAELVVTGGRAAIAWRNAAGKIVKAPPAAVRADHGEELAALRTAAKDIDKMLAAQTDRLDRQILAQRVWTYRAWRARYLDHPLIGTIARRLIWIVDGHAAGYVDGALRGPDDRPVRAADAAPVRPWHPIGRPVEEVLAWRGWLEGHGITQPFKQAHREVYLLTAAEERTRVYSNRFAAHVLRQHQFHALTAVRGWRNRLRMMVDDSYPPAVRQLPGWGLRAEFWIEGAGDHYDTDVTESGAYLRLTTDQVRFYPLTAPENLAHAGGGGYEQWGPRDTGPTDPIPLADLPPLVFSEVMRDVDLFVGVASVGNDATWQDGGPDGRFRDYWASYSFGELTATAQTRRELLARLVPRLVIADRAALDGRFLVVRGELRTYRIHLGSGNVLMSPNDEYLCIVAQQSPNATGKVFLPFEGDTMLAVILSKAMLLARDVHITDPTIVQQIRR